MLNLGIPIEFGPVAGGGGGSKWYAPKSGSPATLPLASGASALAAGSAAVASNDGSIAFGTGATASSQHAVAIGTGASATTRSGPIAILGTAGDEVCIAIGAGSNATGYLAAIAIGSSSVSSAYGSIALGLYAASAKQSAIALGVGAISFNSYEVSRRDGYLGGRSLTPMMSGLTTDATLTNLRCNNTGILVPNNSAAGFRGTCSAWRAAGAGVVGDSAMWLIDGLISNVGGTYTLIGGVAGIAGLPNYSSAGAAGWTLGIAIVANTLRLQATGQAGETIYWESRIDLVTTA